MATQKTHQPHTPSANGTKPPLHLQSAAADNTPKRAPGRQRSKTPKAAKAPKQVAASETAPARAAATKPKKTKKVSALDAAAQLLAETGQAMTCAAMIEAMAAKGSWTSPGGKTPASTLYTAVTMLPKTA